MARPSERDRYKYGICTNRDKNGEGTPCPKPYATVLYTLRIRSLVRLLLSVLLYFHI